MEVMKKKKNNAQLSVKGINYGNLHKIKKEAGQSSQ